MNLPKANSTYEPVLVTRDGQTPANDWRLLADDEAPDTDGQVVLGFERALRDLDGLNGNYGVRVNPGDDVRRLEPYLSRITLVEVAFPGFRDGRGYSTARILREAGFTGAVRAVGDVLRDQLFYMMRCGFDEFVVKDRDPAQAITSAAKRFSTTYQGAADSARPAWALRFDALRHPA